MRGSHKEETEKDKLAQFALAAQPYFILADYDISVVRGVIMIVLGVIAVLFYVGVVAVSYCIVGVHLIQMLATPHARTSRMSWSRSKQRLKQKLESVAPEFVQPAREHVRRKGISSRTKKFRQKTLSTIPFPLACAQRTAAPVAGRRSEALAYAAEFVRNLSRCNFVAGHEDCIWRNAG